MATAKTTTTEVSIMGIPNGLSFTQVKNRYAKELAEGFSDINALVKHCKKHSKSVILPFCQDLASRGDLKNPDLIDEVLYERKNTGYVTLMCSLTESELDRPSWNTKQILDVFTRIAKMNPKRREQLEQRVNIALAERAKKASAKKAETA